jgi:hypothetical protein
MVTRADDNITELTRVTHPILMDYAKQWGCDFIVMDTKEDWMTDYELAHYRILRVGELLESYERILIIDSDIIITPSCPNPFDEVPEDYIGTIYEDKGSREPMRQGVIMSIQERWGDVGWEEGYINTGFFVVSRQHKNIFQKINDQLWTGFGYDDALIGYNIHKFGHNVHELSYHWNHMSMHSENWNGAASRFLSHVIHYAGMARFPDDQSGRVVTDNNMASRLLLIKNDIDRMTEGLMSISQVTTNEFQGQGSKLLRAKIGIEKRDIVLKVPIDSYGVSAETRLKREVHTYNLKIPNTVEFLGIGVDAKLGKFMMLEPLHQLPLEMVEEQAIEVAVVSLITLRQLYKHGIPWICKLQHIMINAKGEVRLADFNDEPWDRVMRFYHHGDEEAIVMDGVCDENGIYQGKDTTPWSGWMACMAHLAKANNLNIGKIWGSAEEAMWAHEYQQLKNVHQPVFVEQYAHLLRTETEKHDKDYGELVPANRACVDRENIINANMPECLQKDDTWLDIGSNVGWFCQAFAEGFKTTGLEADKDMVVFAEMQSEYLGSRAKFLNIVLDLQSAADLPEYDVISALSVIHWSLIKPPEGSSQTSIGNGRDYFWDLLEVLCSKARKVFYLEFPPHSYGAAGVINLDEFITGVRKIGKFKSVESIGVSDAGRPILLCQK